MVRETFQAPTKKNNWKRRIIKVTHTLPFSDYSSTLHILLDLFQENYNPGNSKFWDFPWGTFMGNQTTSAANRRDSNADESDQLTSSNPRFDERSIFGNIRSTPDGKTIYRDKTVAGIAYAAVNRRLEDGGIYEWKFCIDEDSRASCCGVADCPLSTPPRVSVGGEDDDLFASKHLRICRSNTGQLYDRGVQLPETIAPFWKAGSIVSFVADLATKGTISVGVGENDPIVAFRNVTGPLVPIVVFQARFGKKVTLVDFKRVTEMAATRSPSPPRRTSEDVRTLCKRAIDGVGFDRNSMEGSLDLSEDCMTLSRTEGMRGNAICAFNRRISRGCASWTFRVYADTGASTIIGVAEDEAHILPANACVFYSPHVYAWRSYEGRVYEKGNEVPNRLPTFDWANECSTIGVVLDMDARTMWFTCDKQILTVPVSGFNGPVRPIVGFYAGMPKCVAIDNYFESENPEEEEESADLAQAAAVVSYGDPINFHNSTLVGRLEVINGGDTLFRMPGTLENSYCLANIPLGDGSGTYEWTVVIEQDTGASTCLGVAERPIELSADKRQSVYESPSVWLCRSYRGQLYARGVELTTRMICPFWQPGCVVKLTFNADVGTLAYAVDGTDHGVAFRGVPRPVFPFFAFYAMMEKRLTLLHFRHVPPTRRRAAAMNDLSAEVDVRRDYEERKNEKVVRTTKKKPSATVDRLDRVTQCCVCHDAIGVQLQPCMHSIVCWECATKLFENGDNCPQCGTAVTGFLNIM